MQMEHGNWNRKLGPSLMVYPECRKREVSGFRSEEQWNLVIRHFDSRTYHLVYVNYLGKLQFGINTII